MIVELVPTELQPMGFGERHQIIADGPGVVGAVRDGAQLLEEAEDLFLLCKPGMVDKTRWIIPAGARKFEVDEFHGDNEGLVMAEIELGSEDEAFEKPSWLGEEVTGDKRYYNSYLALNPFTTW